MIRNRRQRPMSGPAITTRPRSFAKRAIIVLLGASAPFAATAAAFSTPANAATTPKFRITLSTHKLAFGNQSPGSSTAQLVTLQNTGRKAITPVDRLVGSSAYSLSDSCSGYSLAPGGTCSYAVTFTPSALGLAQGKVQVRTLQGTRAQTIALTGTGLVQLMQTYYYRYTYSNPPTVNGIASPQSYDGVGYAPADTYVLHQTIPVYDSTGLTQVGSYLIGTVSDGPMTDALNTVGIRHYIWGIDTYYVGMDLTSFTGTSGLGSETGLVSGNYLFSNQHPAIVQIHG